MGRQIHDAVRRRHVVDGPEERVRQAVLDWLIGQAGVPAGLIAVEKSIRVQGQVRRPDIVVHDRKGRPWLVVECKAPSVRLDRSVAEQVAAYNAVLKAPYVMVTNGQDHVGMHLLAAETSIRFLTEFPTYPRVDTP
ncbi:MAG: type I restriction enzyme HsdR N-terminal domain-containing protein [Rhodothermales bacterium]